MDGRITLYFDESGTPLEGVDDDGLFVVAGVAVAGNPAAIARDWDRKRPNYKGRKYKPNDMLDLADFIRENRVVPVTSHSRLGAEDRSTTKAKVAILTERLRDPETTRTVSGAVYAWTLQLVHTIVPAALGSLPFVFGNISEVKVSVDQFSIPEWLRCRLENFIREWFDPQRRFKDIISFLESEHPGHPEIQTIRERVQTTWASTVIEWRSGGGLHHLADAVASVYRRSLADDKEARAAWDVLKLHYRRDGRPPLCMGMDLTRIVRETISLPVK